MALPNSIDNTSPAGTDSPSLGDDQIRNLKTFIEDVFTIPNATNIAAAGFTFAAAGLTNVIFQNAAADPDAQGELQRNGTGASALKYYDGTAARILYMQAGTDVTVPDGGTGISSGTSGGVPYFSGATTMASSGVLTANGVVLGGGAGATPIATAAGTADQVLRIPGAGGAPVFGAIDLSQAAAVTGQLVAASFPALTGDITTAGGALATTLANTGPGATGPIGSASVAPVITIDAKGRVTALTSATIAALNVASGVYTVTAGASGASSPVTGLSFTPTAGVFYALATAAGAGASWSFATAVNVGGILIKFTDAETHQILDTNNNRVFSIRNAAVTVYQQQTLTSFDAGGFTVDGGTAGGGYNVTVLYLLFG